MPTLTLDGMTERARTLADRTTSQATRMMIGARPGLTARRAAASSGLAAMMESARGMAAGAQLLRSAPVSARLAWRAGKLVGRAQGAGALAPHAVRGRWLGFTGQLQARTARAQMRTAAQWLPAALAGIRLLGQVWPLLRRPQPAASQATRSGLGTLAQGLGRQTGAVRDAALRGRLAQRAARVRVRANARAVSVATKADAARSAATQRRWRLRRPAPQGAIEVTGRRLRRGWRWTRLFALGIAVGATWAYLFAPRRGPAISALSENRQVTQPVSDL